MYVRGQAEGLDAGTAAQPPRVRGDELDREVMALAGERYARKDERTTCRRHGINPGSVRLAGQQFGIEVPRVRSPQVEVALAGSAETLELGGHREVAQRSWVALATRAGRFERLTN